MCFYFLRQLLALQLGKNGHNQGTGKDASSGVKPHVPHASMTGGGGHGKNHAALDGDSNTLTALSHHLMSIQVFYVEKGTCHLVRLVYPFSLPGCNFVGGPGRPPGGSFLATL